MTEKYPVPWIDLPRASHGSIRRGVVASVLLHLALVLAVTVILYRRDEGGLQATPQDFYTVSYVPLSALDTLLPKGGPPEQAPEAPKPKTSEPSEVKPEPKKEEPKRIVATSNVSRVRAPETTHNTDSSRARAQSPAPTQADSQSLGVPNGQAESIEQARVSYQDMVATLLARAKRYPERAIKRRMTGEGTVRIEIAADGSLSAFQIVRSTESPILDEELRAMVERAAPFPAFPNDLRKNSLALVVPVAFTLEG